MNAKKRRHFARRLREERVCLTRTVQDLERESALDIIEAAPERLQMKDAPSDAEVAEAATSLEMARLREIDAALLRLRERPAQFGRCIVCDEAIADSRLEIVPWTQRCSAHAAQQSHARRVEVEALTKARE
jgi:RNA polymerase-binding transcription factor DksA